MICEVKATKTWKDFQWPEWVPAKLRKSIEDFWCESWGRGPEEWIRDWTEAHPTVPRLGEVCTLGNLCGDGFSTGRYVHAWNNIGRVVFPDGGIGYVCGTRRKYVPNWGGAGAYA